MRRKFRLSRVLRVREIEEEMARHEWLDAELRAREAEARTALLTAERDGAWAAVALSLERSLDPRRILVAHAAVDRIAVAVRGEHERARTLRGQAEMRRPPWEERKRDVRGLQRLREHAQRRERQEELAAEAAELDEIAATRAGRRRDEAAGTSRPRN